MKFIRRNCQVEAIQYSGDNEREISDFIYDNYNRPETPLFFKNKKFYANNCILVDDIITVEYETTFIIPFGESISLKIDDWAVKTNDFSNVYEIHKMSPREFREKFIQEKKKENGKGTNS